MEKVRGDRDEIDRDRRDRDDDDDEMRDGERGEEKGGLSPLPAPFPLLPLSPFPLPLFSMQ